MEDSEPILIINLYKNPPESLPAWKETYGNIIEALDCIDLTVSQGKLFVLFISFDPCALGLLFSIHYSFILLLTYRHSKFMSISHKRIQFAQHIAVGSARRSKCLKQLLTNVRKASEENIAWLGKVYFAPDAIPSRRSQIIDALLEHGSPAAQQAVVNEVCNLFY